ncbi:MAG: phosphoribosylaminoimidazolesuccinocarboxamide synthase [Betaproteobacteria bacterium]
MTTAILDTTIKSLPLISKGKVRDIYAIGSDRLLMITTDRLSAFDVVMQDPIPGKGIVLNQMSNFWFDYLATIIPNHLTGVTPELVVSPDEIAQVSGRAVVTQRLEPILVEAVVRGYLAGSAGKDYQVSGMICGLNLPKGLQNAQKLSEPIFTPAAKAAVGDHDENISFDLMVAQVGLELAQQIRTVSIALYQSAATYAATKGILIADTKFEFGLNPAGQLVLMDEVLTADSSRFWPKDSYEIGKNPPSYDKQFVRDWLEAVQINGQAWNKKSPAPKLPQDIIQKTAQKYEEAYRLLTQ